MATSESHQTVIRVYLVNGESRSVRLDEKTEVVDIVYYILSRLRANIDVALQLFGILLHHTNSGEYHWLTPGYSVLDLITSHIGSRPLDEWRFLLRIRVLPKTPQHLFSQDPVSFSYYYDQILHTYLEDDAIVVDNDTALRLGCLEMRRFFRDMSQAALKKKENFAMLERDYGFEKFFKKSFLQSSRKRNLNKMIQTTFQQYESLTSDGCIFQFFAILGRFSPLDVERFPNCAIGEESSNPLTTTVYVGPNCDVEYETEIGERRFLVSFNDIHGLVYEPELATRGKVTIELKTSSPIVIRTAQLVTAVHLTTLIDGYCQVYTSLPHSRLSNGPGSFRGINSSPSTGGMESLTPNLPFSVDFTKSGKLLNMLSTL